jgi:hypothetical protein
MRLLKTGVFRREGLRARPYELLPVDCNVCKTLLGVCVLEGRRWRHSGSCSVFSP